MGDQQGHKILAWTQIVSRQSASLCSFNSEKFILCNLLLLQADVADKVSLVYSLRIEHLLWHCVTTWALQRHMAGHVLVAGSSVEGLNCVVGPGRDHGTAWHLADPPCHRPRPVLAMEVQPARQDSAGLLTPSTFHYIALFPLLTLLCTTEALPMSLLDDPWATHRVGH